MKRLQKDWCHCFTSSSSWRVDCLWISDVGFFDGMVLRYSSCWTMCFWTWWHSYMLLHMHINLQHNKHTMLRKDYLFLSKHYYDKLIYKHKKKMNKVFFFYKLKSTYQSLFLDKLDERVSIKIQVHKLILTFWRNSICFTLSFSCINVYEEIYQKKIVYCVVL